MLNTDLFLFIFDNHILNEIVYFIVGIILLHFFVLNKIKKILNTTDTSNIILMANALLEVNLKETFLKESGEDIDEIKNKIARQTMFKIHLSKVVKSIFLQDNKYLRIFLKSIFYFFMIIIWPIAIPLLYIYYFVIKKLFIKHFYKYHELNKKYVFGMKEKFDLIQLKQKEMAKENNLGNSKDI